MLKYLGVFSCASDRIAHFLFNPYETYGESTMGRGDRRHSLKMCRAKEQNKKKDRMKRAMAEAKAAKK